MTTDGASWFAERTAQGPERLRERAQEVLDMSPVGAPLIDRLATSGQHALDLAMAAGAGRTAALDLLAADALITLALLAAAEGHPETLRATARTLRLGKAA